MSTKTVQVKPLTLQSSIGTSNTTATVTGMVGLDGLPLTQSDFGSIIFGTFEPNTPREEAVSFTITGNIGGTADISFGANGRGLIGKAPYGTGGTPYTHSAGVKLVISNNPNLFNKFTAKDNNEVVIGAWQFPTTPAGANNPVTKSHLETTAVLKTGDETIAGVKTFSSSPIIPDATTAQQPISKAQFDVGAVIVTGNQTIAGVKTFSSSPIIPDATTSQQPISKAQFDAAGASFSATASPTVRGTTKIDVAADNVADPVALTGTANRTNALSGGGALGTPSGSNKFLTEVSIASSTVFKPPIVRVLTGSGTWTKPSGLKYIIVEVQGGGGSGGAFFSSGSDSANGGSGGSGAYVRSIYGEASLGASIAYAVGGAAGTSSFGGLMSGGGGGNGGAGNVQTPGAAGIASGGNILNINGVSGGQGLGNSGSSSYSEYRPPSGAGSFFGSGGVNGGGGTNAFGAGGGGNGGGGAPGIIIITEYYF